MYSFAAVTNLMALLFSSNKLAGVTGDVRIWNKKESFLARMSALRYWFAFKYVLLLALSFVASDCWPIASSVLANPVSAASAACPARLVSTRSAT